MRKPVLLLLAALLVAGPSVLPLHHHDARTACQLCKQICPPALAPAIVEIVSAPPRRIAVSAVRPSPAPFRPFRDLRLRAPPSTHLS